MTQCPDCGARNAENATFCVRCGARLPSASEDQRATGQDTDHLEPVPDTEDAAVAEHSDEPEPEAGTAEKLLAEASALLSDGQPDAAAARCREAAEMAPDLVAAYSLLGMAEEQRGNTVAAAGAYRRVLQLDPGRKLEREKLEALYQSGAATRPTDEAEVAEDDPIVRLGPWVAGAAVAFCVLVVLTFIGVQHYTARKVERAYETQMKVGREALDSGDYQAAREAFQVALRVRPDDRDAQQGARYARRKLSETTRSRSASAAARPVPRTTIARSSGPNPFRPVPIGSSDEPPDQPQQQPRRQRAPRPPVVTSERVVGGRDGEASQTGQEPVPFGPLEDPGAGAETEDGQSPDGQGAEQTVGEDTRPEEHGTIHIELLDAPPPEASDRDEQAPAQAAQTQSAAKLRRQADQARQRGDAEQAADLYESAISAYRADSEANPENRQANQAAIQACERALELSEAAEDQ